MSDLTRAEVIETLKSIVETYEICHDEEHPSVAVSISKEDAEAFKFAIDSLKTDEAYQIEYEKRDFIEIPEGATNGDVVKLVFPNVAIEIHFRLLDDWWNSPYKKRN